MPFLYIYVCLFSLFLYGIQFKVFCISRLWEISLYGVFSDSQGNYTLKRKNALQRKFARLVTNNIFVIIVTLIITFSIQIVKCCHQALYRYSFVRISPYTVAVLPLFSAKNIPQHHFQYLPACQHLPACQLLPTCESFNKPLLPAKPAHHQDTQHGQEKIPNIMIVIIIIISIR